MKIDLILKAHVEWHDNDVSAPKGIKDYLPLIAALLSVLASLLNIMCH